MHTATFVCLANSRKHNGRCLAGKALFNGTYSKWIRPVTEHSSEELQSHEHCLQSGEDSSILDLLEIQLLQPKGKQHQQENWLMDVSVPLKKKGTLSLEDVTQIVDSPGSLWGLGSSSTLINNLADSFGYGSGRKVMEQVQSPGIGKTTFEKFTDGSNESINQAIKLSQLLKIDGVINT